jgi:hypothetical protein
MIIVIFFTVLIITGSLWWAYFYYDDKNIKDKLLWVCLGSSATSLVILLQVIFYIGTLTCSK